MQKIIVTSQYGTFEILVDDEDFNAINQYRWHVDFNKNKTLVYARNNYVGRLHRFILNDLYNAELGDNFVDHIDGNGLNNQKHNLRVVNNATNMRNNHKVREGKYIGVGYREHAGRYISKICVDKKHISLGYFDTAEEAAKIYDIAAILYFDEIDVLNFPELVPEYKEIISSGNYGFNPKRKTSKVSPTQYRGVSIKLGRNRKFSGYSTAISANSIRVHLGNFKTPEQAARVFDLAHYVCRGFSDETMNFPNDFFEYYTEDDVDDMKMFISQKTGVSF